MTDTHTVTRRALSRAEYIGLGASHEERERVIKKMAYTAAPTKHKAGNYRYGNFVLNIKGRDVTDIFLDSFDAGFCPACYGTGQITVLDVCGNCDGEGCEQCGGLGEFNTALPCQECN